MRGHERAGPGHHPRISAPGSMLSHCLAGPCRAGAGQQHHTDRGGAGQPEAWNEPPAGDQPLPAQQGGWPAPEGQRVIARQ